LTARPPPAVEIETVLMISALGDTSLDMQSGQQSSNDVQSSAGDGSGVGETKLSRSNAASDKTLSDLGRHLDHLHDTQKAFARLAAANEGIRRQSVKLKAEAQRLEREKFERQGVRVAEGWRLVFTWRRFLIATVVVIVLNYRTLQNIAGYMSMSPSALKGRSRQASKRVNDVQPQTAVVILTPRGQERRPRVKRGEKMLCSACTARFVVVYLAAHLLMGTRFADVPTDCSRAKPCSAPRPPR
jgi:hypothetical protein